MQITLRLRSEQEKFLVDGDNIEFKFVQTKSILLYSYPLMKEEPKFEWQHGKYYRCRPSLYESLVIGPYLLDIDGTHLFVYLLDNLVFKTSIDIINKQDIFCAKMRPINENHVGIFGMYKFWIVSLESFKIVEAGGATLPTMIEYVEAKNNYLSILTSDEEGENKLLYFWKFNNQGAIEKTYQPFDVSFPEYEECTEDRLEMAIIESIDYNAKVYLFWKSTNNMIELDPARKLEERYSRVKNIYYLADIDNDYYCEISSNKINICSKKGGKEVGSFTNQKELFRKIIVKNGEPREYFTISDQGVKSWKLENNTEPLFYAESEKYAIENLYLSGKGELVGVNVEKKHILVWKNNKEVTIYSFPNEVIKKIMRVNDTQVCLILQATISKELENQFQVQKLSKMEIFDFETNDTLAKKVVQKLQYKIDVDSAIVTYDGTITFILNEVLETETKKHIFRWAPFGEDKKKQTRKRQIVNASKYHSIRLYPYDRIITFTKGQNAEMYDLFGKATESKSQVTLFDGAAHKIGVYQISGDIKQVELSQNNQIYALGKDRFSIYEINTNLKNRLQKIHELEVAVSFIYPFDNYIIMKKEASILVYDKEFDLVMKEEEDPDLANYRILKINENKFILASDQELSLWDMEEESKKMLSITEVSPNMVQLIGKKTLLVADNWIKSYDFYELIK